MQHKFGRRDHDSMRMGWFFTHDMIQSSGFNWKHALEEKRKRARLMKTASRLTQSELIEVMALQVRADERKARAAAAEADDDKAPVEESE